MNRSCLDPQRLQSAAQGQALDAGDEKHLETCATCQEAVREARWLAQLLEGMGQTERDSTTTGAALWRDLEPRLESPGLLTRLPLSLAGLSRLAHEALKPAVAAAWAVGVVGLLLGIWLAPRSPASQPQEPYTWSSLVENPASLSALYEDSFDGSIPDDASIPPAIGDDSSGAEPASGMGGPP